MKFSDKDYLVLLTTCQLAQGKNKNILINYASDQIYDLPNEYLETLNLLKNFPIVEVAKRLDDKDSRANFNSFIEFLIKNEMAYVTSYPESFPSISSNINNDSRRIIDGIVEITKDSKIETIQKFCIEISNLDCRELQLWIVNEIDVKNLRLILNVIVQYNYSYVEIHSDYNGIFANTELVKKFINAYPILKKVYLYSAPYDERIDIVNHHENFAPLSIGEIIFIKEPFEEGKCCGQIHFSSLDFSGYWVSNMLHKKNGCLYKKISLDRSGYIKNCPCMEMNYGHILSTNILDVMALKEYQKWGEIKKDDIEICKDCVFRYNCSDCRAFRCSSNIYSKPKKCTYNPYTNRWK